MKNLLSVTRPLIGILSSQFGRGFSKTNLFNIVRFAEVFSDARVCPSVAEAAAVMQNIPEEHYRRFEYQANAFAGFALAGRMDSMTPASMW